MLRKRAAVEVTFCGLAKRLKGNTLGVWGVGEEGVIYECLSFLSCEYVDGGVRVCVDLYAFKSASLGVFTSFSVCAHTFVLVCLLLVASLLDRVILCLSFSV